MLQLAVAAARVLALAMVLVATCTACGHASPVRDSLRTTAFVTLPLPDSAGPLVEVAAIRTVRGPGAPATVAKATGGCPAGAVLVGGGVSLAPMGGGTPPPSLHTDGTFPSDSSGKPATVSGARPGAWTAVGATGGQLVLGAGTTEFALCIEGVEATSQVAVASVAGPAVAATTARATAQCPALTRLLGGGGLTALTSHKAPLKGPDQPGAPSPSLKLTGSFPSGPDGSPITISGSAAGAWTAVADSGGRTGAGVETTAFAVCGSVGSARTQVAVSTRPGPRSPGGVTTVTASCPTGAVLLSGGVKTGPANGEPQQGLHLTGSFPSGQAGNPVASSGTPANAWTARAEAGGQGSPAGTATTAFAVCLTR
ncbi:MAG: hypothetical protein E6G66_15770 [Actinobacteria bacterium]|nr:MAG: hypothetical protein E6G66_15770 [Actinomycetota bacterium]